MSFDELVKKYKLTIKFNKSELVLKINESVSFECSVLDGHLAEELKDDENFINFVDNFFQSQL